MESMRGRQSSNTWVVDSCSTMRVLVLASTWRSRPSAPATTVARGASRSTRTTDETESMCCVESATMDLNASTRASHLELMAVSAYPIRTAELGFVFLGRG
jgi:hypothetical protein